MSKSSQGRPQQNHFPELGYVRLSRILSVYPVSRSHWYQGVREGRYPQPVKLSEGISAWRVSEIRKLIE